jgi:hypothetical protein
MHELLNKLVPELNALNHFLHFKNKYECLRRLAIIFYLLAEINELISSFEDCEVCDD